MNDTDKTETATFAGGCFWCTEAVFQRLKGISSVISGYTGGVTENPTYEEVCSGKTGHAEAIQVAFNPDVIPYEKLLEIFFHFHDPTTKNQQGNDVGSQYRSAIFYHDEKQKKTAEKVIKAVNGSGMYKTPAVTQLEPFKKFYKAENYHQNYYNNNSYQPYCQYTIDPKLQKLLAEYRSDLKP